MKWVKNNFWSSFRSKFPHTQYALELKVIVGEVSGHNSFIQRGCYNSYFWPHFEAEFVHAIKLLEFKKVPPSQYLR